MRSAMMRSRRGKWSSPIATASCFVFSSTTQHKYPTQKVTTYSEMIAYIEGTVGCHRSTYEEMCGDAHFSPGVARGGRFTRFTCRCCGYSPTEAQWRKDLKSFQDASDKDQAAERDTHNEIGQDQHSWRRHN